MVPWHCIHAARNDTAGEKQQTLINHKRVARTIRHFLDAVLLLGNITRYKIPIVDIVHEIHAYATQDEENVNKLFNCAGVFLHAHLAAILNVRHQN